MTDNSPHNDLTHMDFLFQQKEYLYVRVVKAKDLLAEYVTGRCDPYVEVQLGNYKETSCPLIHFESTLNPEWNKVFAFSRDKIDATMLEVSVKDKDNFLGWFLYDLCVVPKRQPSDSPLDPKWYRLEGRNGEKAKGELMLAVWWGTQADEAFLEADSVGLADDDLENDQSKVYRLPRLWYVRVNVIQGKDLIPHDRDNSAEIFVKATIGNQATSTKPIHSITMNPAWNEELMSVAAEPFEENLIMSVEERVSPSKDEVIGMCVIPLRYVDRRFDNRSIESRWFNLQRDFFVEGQKANQNRFAGRIHMSICLEGGYHVMHESAHYSDFRPTATQLWKKSIGILELGILSAHGLSPMKTKDGRATTDAYCVAKYGPKWVRTRTIIDSFTPKWNEQYTWQVYDPCTIITIGVFDNSDIQGRDQRMGKVRIRVSTLEINRIYTDSYPLFVLHPSGLKKMGEIHLAVRFTCSSMLSMINMYSQPLWPEMHYIRPLTHTQLETLKPHATKMVSMSLSRAEPPLSKEVVEYMVDVDYDMFCLRRCKANYNRIMSIFCDLLAIGRWSTGMYDWKDPTNSVAPLVIFFISVMYPKCMPPSLFLYLSLKGIWNYKWRPRHPPHIDSHLSCEDKLHPDELEEEFDTFPTSQHGTLVIRMRYDRLRYISVRFQTMFGDLATLGEQLQSLLSWRDPRATALFVMFCLIAAIVLYAIPFYAVAILTFLYVSKLTRSKSKLPSVPTNFIQRLPAKSDQML